MIIKLSFVSDLIAMKTDYFKDLKGTTSGYNHKKIGDFILDY